jgi:hypothetical protein
MTAKKTYDQKLSWLRKNGVKFRKKTPAKTTVDRYYSIYKRKGFNVSTEIASGNVRRIGTKIEKGKNFTTPKGKITAKQYVKNIDKTSKKELKKEIPYNVIAKFNHKFKSGKREDNFIYPFRDGKGINVNAVNVNRVVENMSKIDIPDIMETLNFFLKRRGIFYSNRKIGAHVVYTISGKDIEENQQPISVKFKPANEFENTLMDNIAFTLQQDIFRRESTKDGTVHLKFVWIYIRTIDKPTQIELYA